MNYIRLDLLCVLPARLNSQDYLDFLQNNLPDLLVLAENNLEDVALTRRTTIFMHDNAPAYSARKEFFYYKKEFTFYTYHASSRLKILLAVVITTYV